MTEKVIYLDSEIKSAKLTNTGLKIEGYANTVTKDRTGDIILAEAWVKGIENYRKNPVLLFQHKHEMPIGRVDKIKVDKQGIFVEATISKAAETQHSIQSLIKDGALKSFSVGFKPGHTKYDNQLDCSKITELELMEISVVSVPANQDSLFRIRKSFDSDIEYQDYMKSLTTEEVEVEDKGLKAGVTELSDGHYHTMEVDEEGTGVTTYTSHTDNHVHLVSDFEIQEADGHSHDAKLWTQMEKNEEVVLFDNTEEEVIVEETVTEEDNDVEELADSSEKELITDETIIEEERDIDDDEEIVPDYSDPIPFINLLSNETSDIKNGDFVKFKGVRWLVGKTATNELPNFMFKQVDIHGKETGHVLNINAPDISIANVWDINSEYDLVLVDHTKEIVDSDVYRTSIKEFFDDYVTLSYNDLIALKETDKVSESSLYQTKLNKIINLKLVPSQEWTATEYDAANRIINTISVLKDLESSEANKFYLNLHGYDLKEKSEMATQNVGDPIVIDTAKNSDVTENATPAEEIVTAAIEVGDVREEKLLEATAEAVLKQVDNEAYERSSTREDDERVTELSQQVKALSEKLGAMHSQKMTYQETSRLSKSQYSEKDMANAYMLSQALLRRDPFDTKIGMKMKAVTTVDQFLSNFSTNVFEEMEQQLVIAPMLTRISVDARNFRVPVVDEDTDGDVAQFASGTFATGVSDATNVPTSNQHTIKAVNFTPHKFMAATHLAKDEEEDTILPLIDFLRAAAARRLARALDKAILRGDGALTGFTAQPTNAIVAAGGYSSVITGIVTHATAASLTVNSTASTQVSPANIATGRATLGKYGLQLGDHLVYITSAEGYNDLVQQSDFRTVDKFGENATYLTGSLGAIYGIPVVISEFMSAVAATGNRLGALVYKPGFMIAERRGIELESEYEPRQQVTAMYLSTRFDMQPLTTVTGQTIDSTYSMAVAFLEG